MSAGPAANSEGRQFQELFRRAEAEGRTIRFWWRDDDAETATPQLEFLLALARRHALPLGLAVIPKRAIQELADRLAGETAVAVLQHGWSHKNHAAAGEKKIELDAHRPLAAILDELRAGRERLSGLFPAKFLPVLVPPWNRVATGVRDRRGEAGLPGLSVFGPADGAPHVANVHVDIIDWTTRGPLDGATIFGRLSREMERRLAGSPEPIGIMTHHLIQLDESWSFLDQLFEIISASPAASWPRIDQVFGLTPVGSRAVP